MIRTIFIPEKIGSYYVWPKKIVGIDIGPTEIYATLCIARGNTRTIRLLVEQPIGTEGSHQERITTALKNLQTKLGAYDMLFVALPSSLVVFKELSLPFIGLKKIKQVIPFEAEALLPFTLESAIIDVIVTQEDRKNKSSQVLIAAVKKEYLNDYLQPFEAAGIQVDKVTVDMFELYGFYQSIPSYQQDTHTVALIDLGFYTTRIALITDGQLKYIRSINKGLVTIAKKLSTTLGTDTAQSLETLMRFGLEENESTVKINEAFDELMQEIKLSILSYTQRLKATDGLNKVIIMGAGADMPGIVDLVRSIMGVEVQILQAKKMIHNGQIQSDVKTIPNSFLVSIATALSSSVTDEFNLLHLQQEQKEDTLLTYQIISLCSLALLMLFSFSLYSYLRVRNLRAAYNSSQTEAVDELRRVFKLKPNQTVNLEVANRAATTELRKQETAWQRLSTENRYSLLRDLTELSKCVDTRESQLNLSSLSIKDDVIKLYGSVPGYEQLTKLQNQLSCPWFKKLPKLQDLNFKSEPITLTVNKEQEL